MVDLKKDKSDEFFRPSRIMKAATDSQANFKNNLEFRCRLGKMIKRFFFRDLG